MNEQQEKNACWGRTIEDFNEYWGNNDDDADFTDCED